MSLHHDTTSHGGRSPGFVNSPDILDQTEFLKHRLVPRKISGQPSPIDEDYSDGSRNDLTKVREDSAFDRSEEDLANMASRTTRRNKSKPKL